MRARVARLDELLPIHLQLGVDHYRMRVDEARERLNPIRSHRDD